MTRITVTLPEKIAATVSREAHRRRVSVSEVVRQALRKELNLEEDRPRHLAFIGIGKSEETQTAKNAEEIIAREWGNARRR